MDMQTTLGTTEARARAEQLRGEILSALAEAEAPLTSRQLVELCDSAESVEQLTKQLGTLKKSGAIEQAGECMPTDIKRGAKAVPTYRITPPRAAALAPEESARLANVLEATLDDTRDQPNWPDALEEYPARKGCRAPFHANEATDGDEFAAPRPILTRHRGDPILALIDRMDDYPEPKIQEGAMHEARIGALVARLERGLPIYPDRDLTAYLADVRDLFGALSA